MRDTQKIKQLQSQYSKMRGEAEAIQIEVQRKQKEHSDKIKAMRVLKKQIDKIDSNGELRVSEHALIRYFERVKGFSIEEIESEILSDEIKIFIETLGGSGTYPNNGYSVVMKDNTVTTIISNNQNDN